jgi:hypothetical protein
LEGIDDAVDETNLEIFVDVRGAGDVMTKHADSVEHDLVLCRLFLEGIDDAVDEANLELFVDVRGTGEMR